MGRVWSEVVVQIWVALVVRIMFVVVVVAMMRICGRCGPSG